MIMVFAPADRRWAVREASHDCDQNLGADLNEPA